MAAVAEAGRPGRLSVVATPIGNLADVSTRLQDTLAAADVVLAEDTRRTGRLLQQFGMKCPLLSLHEHNEADTVDGLVARLLAGEHLALVSDAGTPTVSDPGFRLVSAAHDAGVRVEPVPGPSAVMAALSAAGLPTDRFCFEGFLPARQAARRTRLEALQREPRTLVFFVAVHRVSEVLEDCAEVFGAERTACIARELTKRHEQVVRDTLAGLQARFAAGDVPARGEFVLLVGGAPADTGDAEAAADTLVAALVATGIPVKSAVRAVASATGASRNALYASALARDAG